MGSGLGSVRVREYESVRKATLPGHRIATMLNNGARKQLARKHTDLEVYQRGYAAAMRIFQLSKKFPKEEMYSLTDQIRRSSRSVCSGISEAWRKRRYQAAFISKLGESEAEAAETQTWIQFAVGCEYLSRDVGSELYREYDALLATLVDMISHASRWILK
jgi:four helix bundle protein